MKYDEMNKAMVEIAEVRNALAKASTGADKNKFADQLEVLELDFIAEYGSVLNEVIMDVYDEYSPDTEAMPLNYYFANYYRHAGKNEFGVSYEVGSDEGLYLEIDDFPNKDTRIVFVPNPLRLVLNIDENDRRMVWNVQKPSYVM